MKAPFWKRPASEGGPRLLYLGWGVAGRWVQRGPLTRAEAVRIAAAAVAEGHAPYASVNGSEWVPLATFEASTE